MSSSGRQRTSIGAGGQASKGSQFQVQMYVNERPQVLDRAILDTLPELKERNARLIWKSPLASEGFQEYQDGAFLEALGRPDLKPSLQDFWPSRGPVWDALAQVECGNAGGVLLVEGKSYPEEMNSKCGAEAKPSVERIRRSILRAFGWHSFPAGTNYWLDQYYQAANRVAHLHWFAEIKVPAWLVNLCFINDPTHTPEQRVSRDAWEKAVQEIYALLQVPQQLKSKMAHVFLPGLEIQSPAATEE